MSKNEVNMIEPITKHIIRSIVLEKIKTDQKLLDINGINKLVNIIEPMNEVKNNIEDLNDMDKSLDNSMEKINNVIITMEHNNKKNTINDLKIIQNDLKILKNKVSKINPDEIIRALDKMMNQYTSRITEIVKYTCEEIFEEKIESKIRSIENCKDQLVLIDDKIKQLNKQCDNLVEKTENMSENIKSAEETVEKISRIERMSRTCR